MDHAKSFIAQQSSAPRTMVDRIKLFLYETIAFAVLVARNDVRFEKREKPIGYRFKNSASMLAEAMLADHKLYRTPDGRAETERSARKRHEDPRNVSS